MQTPTNLSLIPDQLAYVGLTQYSAKLLQLIERYGEMTLHIADKQDEPENSVSELLAVYVRQHEQSVPVADFIVQLLRLNFNYYHVWLDDKKWNPLRESLHDFDPSNESFSMELEQPLLTIGELQHWLEGISN